MKDLFKEIRIWKRTGKNEATRYNCFQRLTDNKVFVQSADSFRLQINRKHVQDMEDQLAELFVEDSPDMRSDPYDSVAEAIAGFEQNFGRP